MTAAQFRKIALSFPEAIEASHMDHPDFRVGGRIFATLGHDESFGVVMIDREDQEFFMKVGGDAFKPAAGAWGQKGWTVITLRDAMQPLVREAIEAAWRLRAPKRLLTQR